MLITLFLFELSAYLTVTSTTDLVVDELVDETLRVNFNVTLHGPGGLRAPASVRDQMDGMYAIYGGAAPCTQGHCWWQNLGPGPGPPTP